MMRIDRQEAGRPIDTDGLTYIQRKAQIQRMGKALQQHQADAAAAGGSRPLAGGVDAGGNSDLEIQLRRSQMRTCNDRGMGGCGVRLCVCWRARALARWYVQRPKGLGGKREH